MIRKLDEVGAITFLFIWLWGYVVGIIATWMVMS